MKRIRRLIAATDGDVDARALAAAFVIAFGLLAGFAAWVLSAVAAERYIGWPAAVVVLVGPPAVVFLRITAGPRERRARPGEAAVPPVVSPAKSSLPPAPPPAPTFHFSDFFRPRQAIEVACAFRQPAAPRTQVQLDQALLQLTAVTRPHRLADMLAEVDRREAMFVASGTGRPARLEALESVRDDVIRGRLG